MCQFYLVISQFFSYFFPFLKFIILNFDLRSNLITKFIEKISFLRNPNIIESIAILWIFLNCLWYFSRWDTDNRWNQQSASSNIFHFRFLRWELLNKRCRFSNCKWRICLIWTVQYFYDLLTLFGFRINNLIAMLKGRY